MNIGDIVCLLGEEDYAGRPGVIVPSYQGEPEPIRIPVDTYLVRWPEWRTYTASTYPVLSCNLRRATPEEETLLRLAYPELCTYGDDYAGW